MLYISINRTMHLADSQLERAECVAQFAGLWSKIPKLHSVEDHGPGCPGFRSYTVHPSAVKGARVEHGIKIDT